MSYIIDSTFIKFLIKAKKSTYANSTIEKDVSSRIGSSDYNYEEVIDNKMYTYHDTYFGGTKFMGEEVVYCDSNKPIWGMNYYGITYDNTLGEDAMVNALRPALMRVGEDNSVIPVRGPIRFEHNGYVYTFKSTGTIENFEGIEQIYKNSSLIYELHCSGGIIEQKGMDDMLLSNIDFKELTDVLIDRIVFGFPDDDGKNGDCILVFGSKRWMNERVNHAVKLFNEKRAPYILFSGGLGQHSEVPESELMRQMAIAMGVPSEAIIYEGESKNTTENVLCSLLALERKILLQDIKRLIIVSSPHHMQRCMLTLSRYMPKWIEYTYSCDNSSICARDNWKINEESKISVKKEAAKLLFYSKNKYIDDKEIDWLQSKIEMRKPDKEVYDMVKYIKDLWQNRKM